MKFTVTLYDSDDDNPSIKTSLIFYALGLVLMAPAFLATMIKDFTKPCCGFLSFWDFYTSVFMVIALGAFVCFFAATSFLYIKNPFQSIGLNTLSCFGVLMAIPNINGFIYAMGDLQFKGALFATLSILCIFLFSSLYFCIVWLKALVRLKMKEEKQENPIENPLLWCEPA